MTQRVHIQRERIQREYGDPPEVVAMQLRRRGWRQAQIAKHLAASQSAVSQWLRTARNAEARLLLATPTEPPPDPPARAPVPLERAALSLVTQRAAAESAPRAEATDVA